MDKLSKNRWLGVISLAIAAFFAYQSSDIVASDFAGDPGPKVFPFAGCILLALCGIGLIVKKPEKQKKVFMTKQEW